MLLKFEVFDEHVFYVCYLDDPRGNGFFLLFLFDDYVGGIDLFFLQFAVLDLLDGLDGGLLLIAE